MAARKTRELSGKIVYWALVKRNPRTRRYYWMVGFSMTDDLEQPDVESDGEYETALAASRSLKDELMKHSPEF